MSTADEARAWEKYVSRTGVPKPIMGTLDWHDERAAHRSGFTAGAEWQASRQVTGEQVRDERELVAAYDIAGDEYTPLTENVRLGYAYRERLPEGERHHPGLLAEFDRWLAAHDAEALAPLTAQLQAAQAKLAAIRSTGAHSGTDINAWNKAFDVLDAADTSVLAEHDAGVRADEQDRTIQRCKAELDEAHRFEDGVYEIAAKLGFTGRGLGKRTAVLDALSALATARSRGEHARAASIEQTEADRG